MSQLELFHLQTFVASQYGIAATGILPLFRLPRTLHRCTDSNFSDV